MAKGMLQPVRRHETPLQDVETSPPCRGVRENPGEFAPRDGNPDASADPECGALLGNPRQVGRPSLALGPVEIRALKKTQRLVSF